MESGYDMDSYYSGENIEVGNMEVSVVWNCLSINRVCDWQLIRSKKKKSIFFFFSLILLEFEFYQKVLLHPFLQHFKKL